LLLLAIAAAAVVFSIHIARNWTTSVRTPHLPSSLAPPPDWSRLDAYRQCIERVRFEEQMDDVFTMSNRWKKFITVDEAAACIETGEARNDRYTLRFASNATQARPPKRWWRAAAELGPAPRGKPLADLHIAIDPGHLGGHWARMEERWLQPAGGGKPITEGDLTLKVARLLKPRLEALGARVTLVRDSTGPVTRWRPESLHKAGLVPKKTGATPAETRKLAEKLFYRTAEIRARARKINDEIRPDLVLCLHFNAEFWGDPHHPRLSPKNHFHILINGAFTDGEIARPDQRLELLLRLLQGTHPEEAALGAAAARVFAQRTGLPPFRYSAHSKRARNIDNNPYLWARNLLANRLYLCPVLFYEPYVMNNSKTIARIQAGDYPGTRSIARKNRPSIFREYADAVAAGLAAYYAKARKTR
jgi:N-acetylmuramoyl-L-alanine amidase